MYETLALGALLHDIGKVGQRAHYKSDGLSNSTLGLADFLCPTNKDGIRTHLHVLYTNEFVDRIKDVIPRKINISDLANLAAYHHKPADELQKIISEADHLSSAMEREGAVSDLQGGKDFRKVPLNAIIDSLDFGGEQKIGSRKALDLRQYIPEAIFPANKDVECVNKNETNCFIIRPPAGPVSVC